MDETYKRRKWSIRNYCCVDARCLLGAAALAMDLGSAYSTGAKVQNTCDAAALAAAKELPNRCSTESVAKQFVKENGINPKYAKITINDSSSRVKSA